MCSSDLKHAVVVAAEDPAPRGPATVAAEPPARRQPAASQSALVREAMDHPLVVHARTLFDAAIRKVEPARQQPEAAPVPAGVQPREEDELDHRDDAAAEPEFDAVFRGERGDG